jgi:hypothetical protein
MIGLANMENETEHHEIMTTLAVFQATMEGKLNAINGHLATLNGQTSRHSGAIVELQNDNRSMREMIYIQGKQEKERIKKEEEREEEQDKKQDGWKKAWRDLFFGTLQWLLPATIIGILFNGRAILTFLHLDK